MHGLFCSPTICPSLSMRECGAAGSATCFKACPVLRHSESGPLGLSRCECGVERSASGWTAFPVRHSASLWGWLWPRESSLPWLSPPLLPVWKNVSFFISLVVGLPCHSIFCQLWLCKEAQCVYLCRHLGSPRPSVQFLILSNCPVGEKTKTPGFRGHLKLLF